MDTDIRCPSCRSIDLWRDGFVIVEDDAGELIAQRAAPAVGDRSTWKLRELRLRGPRLDAPRPNAR